MPNALDSAEIQGYICLDHPIKQSLDHPVRWNLELGTVHEFTAWRLKHLPPRVYINGDKHTIELYVVINQFGRFLLTNWSTDVLGRSYVAICKGCTFIYTRTSCSMDWNLPGGPMLKHAWHKWRSKQTIISFPSYKHTWIYVPIRSMHCEMFTLLCTYGWILRL